MFTKGKIAVVSVINDLVTDQRVQKSCAVLNEAGYDVILIGRELPGSLPVPAWPWKSVRMKMLFKKGPLFYFFFNLRLLFKLVSSRADLFFSNDLDTLAPNYLVSKWKKKPLVYDSHELFCDVPELLATPAKRKIWQWVEGRIVPKLKNCITVNESIARIFTQRYGTPFHVIRNIPVPVKQENFPEKSELGLPADKKIILLQGAGINIDRGAEELVDAMKHLDNVLLLIVGGGDVWPVLEEKVKKGGLESKVRLIRKIPKKELIAFTHYASIGISIDKNTNPNYYNSLPNKIFDYIHASVPVLASRLPEIERIINAYRIGWFIENHDPLHIAGVIGAALSSEEYQVFRENTGRAAAELNWSAEKEKYLEILRNIQL